MEDLITRFTTMDSVDVLPLVSPSSSKTCDPEIDSGPSIMERTPTEVLTRIFFNLDLKDRARAAQVCYRWNDILMQNKTSMDNVVVFNIFEKSVWDDTLSKNQGIRVDAIEIDDIDALKNIIQLVGATSSAKLWYSDMEFANECIDVIADSDLRMKCVDIYPYSPDLALERLHEKLPHLPGLTMRPHGTNVFWDGLNLPQLPLFSHMTTLVMDGFNLMDDVVLPATLTTLEFQNRKEGKWLKLLPKLSNLTNLEYFSISHADMTQLEHFRMFLDAVGADRMPKLSYLIMRFCKFSSTAEEVHKHCYMPEIVERTMALKMLKLDLCYGACDLVARQFMDINSGLAIVSLNVMLDAAAVRQVFEVTRDMHSRKVWLHFGVLQRDAVRTRIGNHHNEDHDLSKLVFPDSFHRALTKFEASFVDAPEFFDNIIHGRNSACQEMKFIQCKGLNNGHLMEISESSKMMRKMSVINCESTDEHGMLHFVKNFDLRISKKLEIVWKRAKKLSRPAQFYLNLVHEHRQLLEGLRQRFYSKTFSDQTDGEAILIWNKNNKRLEIQDFSEHDAYRVIGVVIPNRRGVPLYVDKQKTSIERAVERMASMGRQPPVAPDTPPPAESEEE